MTLNLFNQKIAVMLFLSQCFYQTKAQQRFEKSPVELAKIEMLKAKVEANPADIKLHENFIEAYNSDDPSLEAVYNTWTQKFPKIFAIPFAIGKAYVNRENPKATPFLLRAIVLKPDNAELWDLMAQDASLREDLVGRQDYLSKAILYAPKNPEYAFYYANSFQQTDPAKYDSLSLEVARKFPESEQGAQALYWLAANSKIDAEKLAYFKQLQHRKASQNSSWYLEGMKMYFDFLLQTNTNQAFELGLNLILYSKSNLNIWKDRIKVADGFIRAKKLLNDHRPNEAIAILNVINLGSLQGGNTINSKEYLTLYKAEAQDSAKMFRAAYDTIATYYSKKPSENLLPVLFKYGKQNGMDTLAVNQKIASIRSNYAKKATDFALKNYRDGATVSLADYAGKVVLVTYWFPGCAPCKAEFPHFENALKNFNKTEVGYLALNIEPSQNDAVLPLLKQTGFSFTALHDSMSRMKGNLDNGNSAPVNFLIDKKGRIAFSHFRIDGENEKTLELMIKETLAEKEE